MNSYQQPGFLDRSYRLLMVITLSLVLLYVGRTLFITLAISALVSFVLYPICRWLESKKISRGLSIAIGLGMVTALIAGLIYLLVLQVNEFRNWWPTIQSKLTAVADQISIELTEHFNIAADGQQAWLRQMAEKSLGMIGQALFATGGSLATMLIIPVYTALILYNRRVLVHAVQSFFPENNATQVIHVLRKTIDTYYNFIKGMLVVYLTVGTLNSIGLFLLGIPQAFLFGYLASVMTFIPYVGIMIASVLPITVAWITKDSLWYPAGVVMVFAIVQYLEANVIFPLAVSGRLKINTLVTLVVMFAGGLLWGAAGMILFIPFVAIAKLIADETDPQGKLARLLGNGD